MDNLKLTREEAQILSAILNAVKNNCNAELNGKIKEMPMPAADRAAFLAASVSVCDKILEAFNQLAPPPGMVPPPLQ